MRLVQKRIYLTETRNGSQPWSQIGVFVKGIVCRIGDSSRYMFNTNIYKHRFLTVT